MTRFPGSGLQKRIETAERYFSLAPRSRPRRGRRRAAARALRGRSVGCPAAARARRRSRAAGPTCAPGRSCSRTARRGSCRSAPGTGTTRRCLSSTSCLVWALARLAYRKCWPASWRRLHQVLDAVGADRLHDVGTDGLQQHGRVPPCRSETNIVQSAAFTARSGESSRSGRRCNNRRRGRPAGRRRTRCAGRPGRVSLAS